MRLCFSLCRPSVTLYTSLKHKQLVLGKSHEKHTVYKVFISLVCLCPHLLVVLQPGGLLLQHSQLLLGLRQLLAAALQRSAQLVVGRPQLDVLHAAVVLLAVQLVALEL